MNHETRPWFDGCEFICDEEMKNEAFCRIGLKITLGLWDPRGLAPRVWYILEFSHFATSLNIKYLKSTVFAIYFPVYH